MKNGRDLTVNRSHKTSAFRPLLLGWLTLAFVLLGLADAQAQDPTRFEADIQAFERADLVIYVIDAARGLHEEELAWLRSGKKTIAVFNKTDLCQDLPAPMTDIPTICISAKHHQNIDGLLQAMKDLYPSDLPRIFIERHVSLFERAGLALERAREALKEGLPPDIWIMDIDEAVHSLKNLTGEDFSDDVLDSVFSRFCVGK